MFNSTHNVPARAAEAPLFERAEPKCSADYALSLVFCVLAPCLMLASCGSTNREPEPLTPMERAAAKRIARDTDIAIEDAENMVIQGRPSEFDRQRWAAERREREAAGEALQLAYPD